MAAHCPYLGPEGASGKNLATPHPNLYCHASGEAERVGVAFQAAICLTSAYESCPRFGGDAEEGSPGGAHRRKLSRTGIPSVLPEDGIPEERAFPAHRPVPQRPRSQHPPSQRPPSQRPPSSRPASQPSAPLPPAANLTRTRPRVTLVEVVVMGLGLAIVLAFAFIGYAVVYRLQLRSGIEVAAVAPGTPLLPASALRATLVPTFTPTTLATPTPGSPPAAPGLPTLAPPTAQPTPTPTPILRPPAASPPTRLVIPKIDVDVPVLPVGVRTARVAGKERVLWDDVPDAGGFHQTSAYPGNVGNTVINGHRDILGSVFRHLDKVEPGDEIVVYVGDVAYPYRVVEIVIVPETFASAAQRAEGLKYIGYMPEERLTLVTCTPIGLATHRLLIIARPPEALAPGMPEAGPTPP